MKILVVIASLISMGAFIYFYLTNLGIAYNDARSHLDIGRRVVEGLKPGLAQIGSVWLPLPHLLMVPTIWSDWAWHSGFSGALPSMIAYVLSIYLIAKYGRVIGMGKVGVGVAIILFALNSNILYLQSTAMTEVLFIGTLVASVYFLTRWFESNNIAHLIYLAIAVCAGTLIRYDGWLNAVYILGIIVLQAWFTRGKKAVPGIAMFYLTLACFGIFLWIMWNLLIFKDPLYFASGPYSARAQQKVIEEAGMLMTKGDAHFSVFSYLYDAMLTVGPAAMLWSFIGLGLLLLTRTLPFWTRIASTVLLTPYFFNIISLYTGQSALFLQGISADTWFNVRYGTLVIPGVAIWIGYLVEQTRKLRVFAGAIVVAVYIATMMANKSIAIADATSGSSQKNVTEVSGWLADNAAKQEGFVLISTASHDAIVFSSGLPMKKFIHEGTGEYWKDATRAPDQWARWIVMRTHDAADEVFKLVSESGQLYKYEKVAAYPFADVYQLKPEYMPDLHTKPVLSEK